MTDETVKNEVEQTEDDAPVTEDAPEGVIEDTEDVEATEAVEGDEQADAPAAEAETENVEADATAETEATDTDDEPAEEEAEGEEAVAEAETESMSIEDLKPGMEIQGKVKSIELYGAFVDVGVGKDALLHISQLGKQNVRNVEDVVKKGEVTTVYVLKVDPGSERIALSLEKPPENPLNQLQVGEVVEGEAVRIENFGVFVDFGAERPGMIHISELATGFVQSPEDVVKMGDTVKAQIIKVNRKKRQIDLSIKAMEESEARQAASEVSMPSDEDMPTAMELAMRRAMSESDDEQPAANANKKRRGDDKQRKQLDDVLSRTLKQHGE